MIQGIIVCRSIHDVMQAEQLLGDNDIDNDLIPVPREISLNCGMAVEVDAAALTEVVAILRRRVNILGVYRREPVAGRLEQLPFHLLS